MGKNVKRCITFILSATGAVSSLMKLLLTGMGLRILTLERGNKWGGERGTSGSWFKKRSAAIALAIALKQLKLFYSSAFHST